MGTAIKYDSMQPIYFISSIN